MQADRQTYSSQYLTPLMSNVNKQKSHKHNVKFTVKSTAAV